MCVVVSADFFIAHLLSLSNFGAKDKFQLTIHNLQLSAPYLNSGQEGKYILKRLHQSAGINFITLSSGLRFSATIHKLFSEDTIAKITTVNFDLQHRNFKLISQVRDKKNYFLFGYVQDVSVFLSEEENLCSTYCVHNRECLR